MFNWVHHRPLNSKLFDNFKKVSASLSSKEKTCFSMTIFFRLFDSNRNSNSLSAGLTPFKVVEPLKCTELQQEKFKTFI